MDTSGPPDTIVVSVTVPAGDYVVNASVTVNDQTPSSTNEVACSLISQESPEIGLGEGNGFFEVTSPGANIGQIALTGYSSEPSGTTYEVGCRQGTSDTTVLTGKITAVAVNALN